MPRSSRRWVIPSISYSPLPPMMPITGSAMSASRHKRQWALERRLRRGPAGAHAPQEHAPRAPPLRLSGKADDHIPPDGDPRPRLVKGLHHLPEVPRPVTAGHPFEDLVVATLQGQVDIATEAGRSAEESNHLRFDLVGMERAQPDPRARRLVQQALQQRRQGHPRSQIPSMGPQVDSGEDDLGMPTRGEAPALFHHPIRGEAAIRAPDRRDDTEGTSEVAPVLDLQEGTRPIRPLWRRRGLKGAGRPDIADTDVDPLLPRAIALKVLDLPASGPQMPHQLHLLDIAQDQIDPVNGRDPIGGGLRIAAGGDHKGRGTLPDGLPDEATRIGIGSLSHRAGID